MIVRDTGAGWQVVLQTDHADLSAAFARQWADTGARHESLIVATERHDDGWAVWEQAPLIEPETSKPVGFLEVDVPAHLAFYRAAIAAVSGEDAYAGLLVSMHGAGIYRQRYGADPGLKLAHAEEVRELVDAFVAEQEGAYEARMAAVGIEDELRWADYQRLQLYDRFSLYFCLSDVEGGQGGEVAGFRFEPLGGWRAALEPYPFLESPARFSLLRRLVPKQAWTQQDFRDAFPALAAERVEFTLERA